MDSAIVCSGPLAQIKTKQIWQHIHFSTLIADTEWPALFHQASPTVPAVCPRTVSSRLLPAGIWPQPQIN